MRTPEEYNRVSLVQIAAENEVLLVQVTGLKRKCFSCISRRFDSWASDFPSAVKGLLENPAILKVGAGIVSKWQRFSRGQPRG